MRFDHSRTGLTYERNVYIEGDNVTFIPYYPTSYNDTRDIGRWKFYIEKWDVDPPNFIILYVRDDTNYFYNKVTIDIHLTIAHLDRAGNNVTASDVRRTGIPLTKGLNRIPININNFKGDIVKAHITGVYPSLPYQPIETSE